MDETTTKLLSEARTLEVLALIREYLNTQFANNLDKYKKLAVDNGMSLDEEDVLEHCGLWASRDTMVNFNRSLQLDIEITSAVIESYDQPRH